MRAVPTTLWRSQSEEKSYLRMLMAQEKFHVASHQWKLLFFEKRQIEMNIRIPFILEDTHCRRQPHFRFVFIRLTVFLLLQFVCSTLPCSLLAFPAIHPTIAVKRFNALSIRRREFIDATCLLMIHLVRLERAFGGRGRNVETNLLLSSSPWDLLSESDRHLKFKSSDSPLSSLSAPTKTPIN